MAAALTQINGYAHVAARYGFEEAVFLHSLMFWYRTNRANDRNFRDGRWWTYNTIKAFEDIFPWWSAKQIRRIADSCREQGALVTGNYNQDRRDRTVWYSPGDELLALYGLDAETGNCNCPNGQMQLPEQAGEDAQTGKCNIRKPCSNHGETDNTPYSPPEGDGTPADPKTGAPIEAQRSGFDGERRHSGADELSPQGEASERSLCRRADKPAAAPKRPRREKSAPDHNPEAFEIFWEAYPRKDARKKAIQAWDKLKADRPLCRVMYAALKRQRGCEQWAEDGGKYIPLFSTWLNGRKWEDRGVDLSLLDQPQSGGSWADAPD